jgi:hypothetical protein
MSDPRVRTVEDRATNAARNAAAKVLADPAAAAEAKASLGAPAGNSFGSKRLFYPSWAAAAALPWAQKAFKMGFYGVVGIFVILLLLTFIHYTITPVFSFSPNDKGVIPIPTVSDKQTAFTKVPASSDVAAELKDFQSCNYTVGFDLYNTGAFPLTKMPRVIFYRSISAISMTDSDTRDSLKVKFSGSNFALWFDETKNDMFFTVFTQVPAGTDSTTPSTSPVSAETFGPIENIPFKSVQRITIVFSSQFVEIYQNGKLALSGALKNPPKLVPPTALLFPPVAQLQNQIMIGSLAYWPRHLSAREIQAYEAAPVAPSTFFSAPAQK